MQRAGLLGAGAILASALLVQMVGGLNPDVSWLITVCERMLAGQELYTDILELNPPMSALIYLPFVALAQFLRLPPEPLVVLAVLVAAVLGLRASLSTLSRRKLAAETWDVWLVGLAALTVLPGSNFGEREHIAAILLLPLLALSAVRARGLLATRSEMVVAGLAAGLVMTIKPHFALPILLVALFGAAQARSLRPIFNLEHVIAGCVLVAYGLVIWTVFPNYLSEMLPLATDAYVAVRMPLMAMLAGPWTWPIWALLVVTLVLFRAELRSGANSQYLVAAAGFFLVYLIQGKGFVYHTLPSLLLVSMVFTQALIAPREHVRVKALPIGVALLLLVTPGALVMQGNALRREAIAVLAPLGPGLRFANITSQLEIASPLHRDLGGTLVNSGPCLWITLGAVRRRIATDDPTVQAEMTALENFERARLRDDMVANPPDIVLAGADRFDWIGWASTDEALGALLDGYEMMAEIGPEGRTLKILKRKPL